MEIIKYGFETPERADSYFKVDCLQLLQLESSSFEAKRLPNESYNAKKVSSLNRPTVENELTFFGPKDPRLILIIPPAISPKYWSEQTRLIGPFVSVWTHSANYK